MMLKDDHTFERHDLKERKGKRKTDAEERQVEENLKQIYENADGSMPDMRHIDKRARRRFRRAILALIASAAFLAVVAWVGFFMLQSPSTFQEDEIVLSVAGPESVRAGESARYRIRYRNAEDLPLERAVLQVRYPEGFVFTETSRPTSGGSGDSWDLGTVDPDESGYIDIVGTMYGSVDKEQSFRAFLNYTPANFSSEFQKVATARVLVAAAPVHVAIAGSGEAVSGAETELTITVSPEEGVTLPYLRVDVFPGELFAKKSSMPAMEGDAPLGWTLDSLNGEKTFKLSGAFISSRTDAEDAASVRVVVRGWKDAARSGEGYVYAEATHDMKISMTALTVALAINGTTKALQVSPGDILSVSLLVRNGGTTPLDAVVVRAVFDAPSANRQSILEWLKIDDAADGDISGEQLNADTRRGIIVWDSTKIPELKRLEAGEEVSIDFHLPVKSAEDADLSRFKTASITAAAEAQSGTKKDRQIIGSNPVAMTLLSDTSLEVSDEVSETPNSKEVHTISWVVKNSFHDLSDIRVEAELYGDILVSTTTMEVSAGEATWDPATKKLVWIIPAMPTSIDVLALQVPVMLQSKNPTQTNLTSKTTLKATDTVAGAEILRAGDEILLQ